MTLAMGWQLEWRFSISIDANFSGTPVEDDILNVSVGLIYRF